MPEVAPGIYECVLALAPGIYRYKYRLNHDRWFVDPVAAIDPTEGPINSIAIVGGSEPPVYFAPDRGHAVAYEDGAVRLHVESDGPEAPLVFLDGTVLEPETIGLRHGRRMTVFRGSLNGQGSRSPELRVGRYRTTLPPLRSAVGRPPAWASHAVFYAIFVDRWHRGRASIPDERSCPRSAPSLPATLYGGDLWGIAEGVDYLAQLGVDAIVLTPIQTAPSPHRYDGVDPLQVDSRLGGEEAFEHLLAEAHRRDLKVVVDVSLTHVHETHAAFQSVLALQESSPYREWFRIRRFPVVARDASSVEVYPTEPHLPWLNLDSASVQEYAFTAALRLIRLGADGLRLDAMTRGPGDFWSELRRRVRLENPEALLLGEVVTDRPARFAEERGVDLATDFSHREAILDFFRRRTISATDFVERLAFHNFRTGPFASSFRLLFLDNHDTDRFLLPDTPYPALRLALTYLLLRPEPVWLNYGTEMAVREMPALEDKALPGRMPMPALALDVNQTQRLTRALLGMRRRERVLWNEALSWILADGNLLVFDRGVGPGRIRVALNTGCEQRQLASMLPPSADRLLQINEGMVEEPATLGPLSGVVVRMTD